MRFLLLLALIGVVVGHSDGFDPWLLGLSAAPDSAGSMVRNFLAGMTRSVETRSIAVIAELFQSVFGFKGCDRDFNKNQMIIYLSGIPDGTRFYLYQGPVRDLGDNIEFIVNGDGFGVTVIYAVLVLNKQDQKLVYGFAICALSRFTVGSNNPSHYYLI